jgi:hypothetical protein
VPGREGIGAHLARLRGEQKADREEHDLGHPPEACGDQPRRRADLGGPAQGAERELGARHQQFGAVGPGHGRTRVRSGEQPAVFKQVQPV